MLVGSLHEEVRKDLGSWITLVAHEPIEFEKQPVEVQDFRRMTNHFRGTYKQENDRTVRLCSSL